MTKWLNDSQSRVAPRDRPGAILYGAALFSVVFLLRIFYADYVWADEGLWFTTANELLRGKSLYSQIWFDKPPALAWTYAALFRLFGPSILAVRLFTIVYATLVCLALWHLGRRFWGEREGRLAAVLYALYNATYFHSQVQPMAVDQLMLLPYLYSGYFFLTARPVWCGLLAAVAFSLNPKAGALFLFFAVIMMATRAARRPGALHAARPAALIAAGFAAGLAPWLAYLLSGDRWYYYLRDFWGWGFSYVAVYSPREVLLNGLHRTLNYAGFHISPLIGLGLLLWYGKKSNTQSPKSKVAGERGSASDFGPWPLDSSRALWLWLGVSFLGVAAGGRFFPRYFYQVLPFLCLLAARGYAVHQAPGFEPQGAGSRRRVRFWTIVFWLGVAFALVRFHHRVAFLAYEKLTGRQTAYMAAWNDPAIARDSRVIAERVHGSLFVWGYRPEIYFYCGCQAATSYLSDQPLTGVPADIHLREARSVAPERAAEDRTRLLEELSASTPDYIVDGLGPYNAALAMEQYPELRAFLARHYREVERIGQGIIYQRSGARPSGGGRD